MSKFRRMLQNHYSIGQLYADGIMVVLFFILVGEKISSWDVDTRIAIPLVVIFVIRTLATSIIWFNIYRAARKQ